MIKKLCICGCLLLLSGCSPRNPNETSADDLDQIVEKYEGEINALKLENETLKKTISNRNVSFKDSVSVRATVMKKQVGDDLYPYYIIVTLEDRDHNTPLLITIENEQTFNMYEEGSTYDLNVQLEIVIEPDNDNVRFMYYLMQP